MIDIDRFKDYNDCYGHPAGDECLRAIGRVVRACLQRPGDLAARYGGEEIAGLLPETDAAGARALARRMQLAVHQLSLAHAHGIDNIVTFSAGVASCFPGRNASGWQALVQSADETLYEAKTAGRDRVNDCPDPPGRFAVPMPSFHRFT